jgi:hypothetical protein
MKPAGDNLRREKTNVVVYMLMYMYLANVSFISAGMRAVRGEGGYGEGTVGGPSSISLGRRAVKGG